MSDRVRHAAPRGERMPATPAGWRPVAPASKRASSFSSHRSSASPSTSHFLSRAASLPRPAPSSARTVIATAAPPAKLAADGPPLPAIEHTSLRLAPRHLVLAAVTPFEPRYSGLRVFTTVGHGAAVIGLAVEMLPPFLLHPIVLHARVHHLLANPARTPACLNMAGNGRWPADSARAAVASRTSAWRGVASRRG